ncbi:APO protein 3, mitochondrial-like protein [Cinnamomum micranthum f. kanehirae]|uniref:APO protein 3, mitochondrial-like protein n=1 Tax=Cinnamomum micranthum f. kanehirae TaxID=337451 RepID=A0A443PLR1_9MAGN|nr:APO protein 3, mitochondrial-like protein [Cinnamomum micranthum f. kanehirae]
MMSKMLSRWNQNYRNHTSIISLQFNICSMSNLSAAFSTSLGGVPTLPELPRKLQKSERKPFVTNVNELKRRARLERRIREEVREVVLRPPENGLLVKRLVPVAHEVYAARNVLLKCVSRIVESIAVHFCSLCGESHIGPFPHRIRTCNVAGSLASKEHSWEKGVTEHVLPLVESFHLYDRLGRAVSHEERLQVDRIPAIVELCIQAGVDILDYPTRRRTVPVYNIAGKIIDFERKFPKDDTSGKDIQAFGFWERRENTQDSNSEALPTDDMQGLAIRGMEAWKKVRSGAMKLMQKYAVQTCGYCPEVQVGPKGHRARLCQAYKHQLRDGQHAWQEATIDDLLPPVYVWHLQYPSATLVDRLKRYYGKLPAAVELFAQAGAHVPEEYMSLMREDVAVPDLAEEKWVV